MQVSSDVRQRDASDVARTATLDTWPGGIGAFMSVLREENQRTGAAERTTTHNVDEATAEERVENANEVVEAEGTEVQEIDDVTSDEANGDGASETSEDGTAGSDTADADALPDESEAANPEEGAATLAGSVTDPDGTTGTAAMQPPSGPMSTRLSPGGLANAMEPTSTATATAAAAETADGPEASPVSIEVSVDAEGDGESAGGTRREPVPSGQAPFPKTLNALMAEGALRERTLASAVPANTTAETMSAIAAEGQAITLPDDVPDPAPLPYAPAVESGGVRMEMPSLPRIPMSNLPGELAQQIHQMQQESAKTMRIRLVPENLGELRIEIRGHGDTLRVHMTSANAGVRDALNSQMSDLRQALQEQGLSLDNVTVGGDPDHPGSPLDREAPSQRPSRRTSPAGIHSIGALTATASEPLDTTPGALNILA